MVMYSVSRLKVRAIRRPAFIMVECIMRGARCGDMNIFLVCAIDDVCGVLQPSVVLCVLLRFRWCRGRFLRGEDVYLHCLK